MNHFKMANISTANTTTNETEYVDDIIEIFKKTWSFELWKMIGLFGEEDLKDINVHWMKYDQPDEYHFVILAILYIIIMTVGVFGNSLVIVMVLRCKSLRTAANTLIVNLAVSDFLMMIKMPVFIFNSFYKGPALGNIGCQVYGFLGGLTGTVSIVTLSAISLDRFYVIKYPLKLKHNNFRIKLSLIFSWLYGLVFSAIPLLNIGVAKYQYEGYLTSCSFDYLSDSPAVKYFILLFFSAAWLLPFIIITFSYVNIILVVGARTWFGRKDSLHLDSRHIREEDQHRQEVKLAAVVLTVIFLWFFSWTPYAVVALLGICDQKHLITPITSMIPAMFCKIASAVDPFLYAVSHPKFRMELRKYFCKLTREKSVKNNRRSQVWTSEQERRSRYRSSNDLSDVEEEFVTVHLSNFGSCNRTPEGALTGFCFSSPMVTRKTSSFRRLTRKYSSFNRSTFN